jgi:hypothetical protein
VPDVRRPHVRVPHLQEDRGAPDPALLKRPCFIGGGQCYDFCPKLAVLTRNTSIYAPKNNRKITFQYT